MPIDLNKRKPRDRDRPERGGRRPAGVRARGHAVRAQQRASIGTVTGATAVSLRRRHARRRTELSPCSSRDRLRGAGVPAQRRGRAAARRRIECQRLASPRGPARMRHRRHFCSAARRRDSRWRPATASAPAPRRARTPHARPPRRPQPCLRAGRSPPPISPSMVKTLASDEFEGRGPGSAGRGQDRRIPQGAVRAHRPASPATATAISRPCR